MKENKRQDYCIPLFSLLIAVLSICFSSFFGTNSTYAQGDTLALIWSPPKLDSTVSHYKIYCSVDSSDYNSIGTSPDTAFSFMGSLGHTYRVKVSAVNSFGIEGALSEASKDTFLSGVDDKEAKKIPKTFSLDQNFPNPFNSTTAIRYQLPVISGQLSVVNGQRSAVSHRLSAEGKPRSTNTMHVSLKIYNTLGELVNDLVDEEQVPDFYSVIWNGRDNSGREVCSGVYYYQLQFGYFIRTRKMIFLK